MFHAPKQYRVRTGDFTTSDDDGPNGAFLFPPGISTRALSCIASDSLEWEHVSVKAHPAGSGGSSAKATIPTWQEMCRIKFLFWDAEDVVMQLHPRASEYVNNHPAVLHLWRPTPGGNEAIPEPPRVLVGIKA